jgi:hypothetical protein
VTMFYEEVCVHGGAQHRLFPSLARCSLYITL